MMPTKAKAYIACVAVAGLALLALGLYRADFPNVSRFVIYLILALLASTLKISLPGFTGTVSVNFLFLLMGIADYTFSEAIVAACAAALVQSVWRAKRGPQAVQVLFNVATLAVSTGVAYGGSHLVLGLVGTTSLAILLSLATSLFVLTNTGLVSLVVALTERQSLRNVWQQCYALSFPYYLVGAAIAGLVSMTSSSAGWKVSLLILPVMVLMYLFYRMHLEGVGREQAALASASADRGNIVSASMGRSVERVNGGETQHP